MPRKVVLPPAGTPRSDGANPAGWWHESDDGQKLLCDLCPRGCALDVGKRGFCFVRQNLDGRMVSTTYGRSTGFCIDPIEKKPLNQFFPGTAVLSFGTAGCNLGCKFCQNWSTSKSREVASLSEQADPETIAEAARKLDCKSVAFTYNDPVPWTEYAVDTARACRAVGVKTVAVTAGYINPTARQTLFGAMDAANVDLKAFREDFYAKLCAGRLEPVLDTLRWLVHESDVWVEITNLIIPEENDSPEEIDRMCQWIVDTLGPDVPLHFSAFHPDFRLTDRGFTPPETLIAAYQIARRVGLNYVYTGNVSDRRHQSTYCPACERVVIERSGYTLGKYALHEDRCTHCDSKIAGRFDPEPGHWGTRRMPIRIADYVRPKPTDSKPNNSKQIEASIPMSSSPTTPSDKSTLPDKSTNPPLPPGETPMAAGRPELDADQRQRVFQAAGRRVIDTVNEQPIEPLDRVLAGLGQTPLMGAFVTLKRGGQLRSCCGFMGQSIPLHDAVGHAAIRAAKDDPRFPPISPSELEHLDMDVWLLWGLKTVAEKGEDRVGAVTIGKHGLQIVRGTARGLLLPGVATEHHLDARSFLEHVCRKAGLPSDAWKDDQTTLLTFEGDEISDKLGSNPEGVSTHPTAPGGPTQTQLAELANFCRGNLLALVQGATPNFYMPGAYDGSVSGVALSVQFPDTDQKIEANRVGIRPELPLQASLLELVKVAAGSMVATHPDLQRLASARVKLTVYWDPAMHGSVAEPHLAGIDAKHRAVLIVSRGKWCGVFDPDREPESLLDDAVKRARLPDPEQVSIYSMAVASTEPRATVSNATPPQSGTSVRRPAVAGTFYPSEPDKLNRTLDDMLPADAPRKSWAGAMVPHAGWIYSGKLAAETLSRIEFPKQVILFSPKHRPGGSEWAVAPHETWSLPGGDLESDVELARRLAKSVDGFELDAAAHAQEHAIEVQLPILARLSPESCVVGVAMHGGGLAALGRAADQLAELLDAMAQRPLLVVSTDMNHYADERTTRKLDRMALDAIETLDPEKLHQTVADNQVSMCGMLPTVLVMETLKRLGALNRCEPVGYATSAAASGDTSRVVGYAGMLFE